MTTDTRWPTALPVPLKGVRLYLLPLLVGLAAAVASVVLWRALLAQERAHAHRLDEAVLVATRNAVEERLNSGVNALRNLAQYWARTGQRPIPEWERGTVIVIEFVPGLETIEWISPAFPTARIAPTEAQREKDPVGVARRIDAAVVKTLAEREEAVVGPFERMDGSRALQLIVPVPESAAPRGVLSARMSLDGALGPLLSVSAVGYEVVLSEGGREVFRREAEAEPIAPARSLPLRYGPGKGWAMSLAPTAAVRTADTGGTIGAALTGGLLLALLLAGVVFEGQLASARARGLAALNVKLADEVYERQRAEEEVRRLNLELEERVVQRTQALREVIADLETYNQSISHDLRTPLGAIVNLSYLLEESHGHLLGEEARRQLGDMRSSANAAVELMEGLREFSRMGREVVTVTLVDMAALARTVFHELLAARPRAGVKLVVGELPSVPADAAMMRVLWANLLSNALKFTRRREEPLLEIGARREGDDVVFHVRDNGIGFEPGDADRIFRPFERLHRAHGFEGTGLGLAIAARIVQKHGGRAWAESAPSRGTTVYFTLPADLAARTGKSAGAMVGAPPAAPAATG